LNVQISMANLSHLKFKHACRKIKGDLTVTGPDMEAFTATSYDMSVNKGKLTDIYEELQQTTAGNAFQQIKSSTMRAKLRPACASAIDKQLTKALNDAQASIDEIQIICEPPARP